MRNDVDLLGCVGAATSTPPQRRGWFRHAHFEFVPPRRTVEALPVADLRMLARARVSWVYQGVALVRPVLCLGVFLKSSGNCIAFAISTVQPTPSHHCHRAEKLLREHWENKHPKQPIEVRDVRNDGMDSGPCHDLGTCGPS
jgi:hypothetical protein